MSRLEVADRHTQDPDQLEARSLLQQAWGGVPNLGGVLALSLPFTRAMLDFDAAIQKGKFAGPVGEQLEIAVSNANRCAYCLAAHSAAAKHAGVSEQDIADARAGKASDPKVQAALTFAQTVVRERGHVTDEQLAEVRAAGYSGADIVEFVARVNATTLTNYLNHVSEVPVDFPAVDFLETELVGS